MCKKIRVANNQQFFFSNSAMQSFLDLGSKLFSADTAAWMNYFLMKLYNNIEFTSRNVHDTNFMRKTTQFTPKCFVRNTNIFLKNGPPVDILS